MPNLFANARQSLTAATPFQMPFHDVANSYPAMLCQVRHPLPERISSSSCRAYNTRKQIPIATVGAPFSIRDTVRGEQVARSATCATLKLRRNRASFICSPTIYIFCSNFRGNLVPIVLFAITITYHIICKIALFLYFMIY